MKLEMAKIGRRNMQFGRRSSDADMRRTLARVRKLAEREARRTPVGKRTKIRLDTPAPQR